MARSVAEVVDPLAPTLADAALAWIDISDGRRRRDPVTRVLLVFASLIVLSALIALLTPWPLAHYTERHRCGSPLLSTAPAAQMCAELRADGLLLAGPVLVVGTFLGALAISRKQRRSDES